MEQEILDLIEEVPIMTDALQRHRIWLRSVDPVLANAPVQGGLEEDITKLCGLATEVRERVVGMECAEEARFAGSPGELTPLYTPVASVAGAPSDDEDIVMTGTGVAAPGLEFPTLCNGCQRAGTKCIRAEEPGATMCRRCVKKKAKCSRTEGVVAKRDQKRTCRDSGAMPLCASKWTVRDASHASGPRFVLPPVLGQLGLLTEEEEALTVEEISQRMLEALVVAQYYGVLLSRSSGELKVQRANGSVLDVAAYLRWGVRAVESDGARCSTGRAVRRSQSDRGPSDTRSDRGGDDDGEGKEDLEDDKDGEEEEEEESVASGSGKGKGRAR
ncbi:hypothetical protein BOTBODRAFT_179230 [Botryobasidium botryosum FD-172 SS1]|uniref:Uncharacterized protein n=1 Tax=Botryobasidium botryosum (strain FD-172 SS1) TaxID=930990 RepID=A0A067M0X0_BOTB1|nr:hypothetical protein BOTBODRAFT_179230 [Botryobasidium botryosum FD-172 SS1]